MTIRFRPRFAGYRAILLSPEVAADLRRRAERVKAAADSDHVLVEGVPGATPVPHEVRVEIHKDRHVAQVVANHPAALAVEAKHRVLGRAIDAAR